MKLILTIICVCCAIETTQTTALFPNRLLRKGTNGANDLLGRNERLVNWHRKDHHNKDHLAMKTQAQMSNPMIKKKDNKIKGETFTCTDILGDTLEWSPDEPQMYKMVFHGSGSILSSCSEGSFFSIQSCSCETATAMESKDDKQCHIYLPFDEDIEDHSIHRFKTQISGSLNVAIDHDSKATSSSIASARFHQTQLEIPGRLKNSLQMEFSSSWCFFFRCENSQCSKGNTGLLSAGSSLSIFIEGGDNRLVARLFYGPLPENVVTLTGQFNTSNTLFVHVCVTHDSALDKLFIDKKLVNVKGSLGKLLPTVTGPYTVAGAKSMDHFTGSVDEVLICDHAMQDETLDAHYSGNRQLLISHGFIPVEGQ